MNYLAGNPISTERSHSGTYYMRTDVNGEAVRTVSLDTASLLEAKRRFDREVRWLRKNGWKVVKTNAMGDVTLKQADKHITVRVVRYMYSAN